MKLHLQKITEDPQEFTWTYHDTPNNTPGVDLWLKNAVLSLSSVPTPSPFEAELILSAYRSRSQFFVDGTLITEISLICDRCGELFTYPIDSSFQNIYEFRGRLSGGGFRHTSDEEKEDDDDPSDDHYLVLKADHIDLDSLVKEEVALERPLHSLCSEDCRGLCAQCGTNLNLEACHCTPQRATT